MISYKNESSSLLPKEHPIMQTISPIPPRPAFKNEDEKEIQINETTNITKNKSSGNTVLILLLLIALDMI